MPVSLGALSLLVSLSLLAPAPRADAVDLDGELDVLTAAFTARTGARLVFTSADLPAGSWYDVMNELEPARRVQAARLAIVEAHKYPAGYLGALGLRTVGVFDGLASRTTDGFRPWSDALGGYRYFGKWNGDDAIVAAYYQDAQLPLTLHHEIFHHVDATVAGQVGDMSSSDDDRFARAIAGEAPYPAASISANDLAALARRATGVTLGDSVSPYAAKSAGEDQAETARHLLRHLPDALLQIASRPELPGSQRLLHVLDQYADATPDGPGLRWWIDVALAGEPSSDAAPSPLITLADALHAALQARIGPQPGGVFLVWGREDAAGVNHTLRADILRFAAVAHALTRAADGVPDGASILARSLRRERELLDQYHAFIAARWTLTAGTEECFERARAALGGPTTATNVHLARVDAAIRDLDLRAAIRRVQPATVKLAGGSGVNLDRRGSILTAAHVVDAIGTRHTVQFPDGTAVQAVTTALDATLDLAVLTVEGRADLPWAPLAAEAPAAGSTVVVIGQPGTRTPGGEATGYQPWHVSLGKIRGFRGEPLGDQSLGGIKHDAWTY